MRYCGTCNICCISPDIHEKGINKPSMIRCEKLTTNGGAHACTIYNSPEKPTMCNNFLCAWKCGYGSNNENNRPDNNNLMVIVDKKKNDAYGFAYETRQNALIETGYKMIITTIKKLNLPIIIIDYPQISMGDRIVISNNLLDNTNNIRGNLIKYLDKENGLYKLVN